MIRLNSFESIEKKFVNSILAMSTSSSSEGNNFNSSRHTGRLSKKSFQPLKSKIEDLILKQNLKQAKLWFPKETKRNKKKSKIDGIDKERKTECFRY